MLDREWRLSNLYRIVDKGGQEVPFRPNEAQTRCFDSLGNRNVILKARQLGITTGWCILWLDTVLFTKNTKIGIVAHTKDDAAKIFRDKIQYAYERLPDEIRDLVKAKKCDANELILSNGSSIRVGVTFRSGTVQVLHVTELGYICSRTPKRASEVKTGAIPSVPASGIVVVESTAMGAGGMFYDLCQESRKREPVDAADWRFTFLPWFGDPDYKDDSAAFAMTKWETDYFAKVEKVNRVVLTRAQRIWWCRRYRELGDEVFSEYPSTPEEAFQQSTEGSYYGALMLNAWHTGRVTTVPIEQGMLVDTWWDLGMRDSMVIWLIQNNGYETRAVDYYANSGEGLQHYATWLAKWAVDNKVRFGRHIAPHDIKVRELGTGVSRIESAAKLGITFETAPQLDLADGIEAVRAALPRMVFDEERCAAGIRALEHYRKEWDEGRSTFKSTPLHDWASHGADAFRTGIVGRSKQTLVKTRGHARAVVKTGWK